MDFSRWTREKSIIAPSVKKYRVYTPIGGWKRGIIHRTEKKNIPCFGNDKEWPKVNFLRVSETRNPETHILPYKEWPNNSLSKGTSNEPL